MITHLKKRFIIFNMLVIGSVILLIALFVFIGNPNSIPLNRWIVTAIVTITAVIISSLILSNIALAPIKNAWQKQLQFTADASHELRTPLSVIQTNLELVLDSPNDSISNQSIWIENALIENERMSKLVNDLLILSRADTNKDNILMDNVNLSKIIIETSQTFIPLAIKKNITLNTNIDDSIFIHGSESYLKQLLIILLDNAIKYIPSNNAITVSLTKNKKAVSLIVQDTGDGIADVHLPYLFDRFYRVDTARVNDDNSSGLGLSIAKWIVDKHTASIDVTSTINEGTTFTINFTI
ncbi:MAG: sensor histidine kinase [Coprobacillaceae bacterium]